jgi:hypothetical protein
MSRASEIDSSMLAHLWTVLLGRDSLDDRRHIEGWLAYHHYVTAGEIARIVTRIFKNEAAHGHRIASLSFFDGVVARADMEAKLLIAPVVPVRCPRCGQLDP